LRSQQLERIMRWRIKRVFFNVKSVQLPGTGKNPRFKRDGVLNGSVLTRFYCSSKESVWKESRMKRSIALVVNRILELFGEGYF